MFENLNWWEIVVILLVAIFIFGPERLPKVIGDAARWIRKVREMARNATGDLSRELGTDVKLEDLHPKTFVRKHLLSEEDEAYLRRPIEDAYRDVKDVTAVVNDPNPDGPANGYGSPTNGSHASQPSHAAQSGYSAPAGYEPPPAVPPAAAEGTRRYDDVT
jgi:sec-independent protein translocase protein TatB